MKVERVVKKNNSNVVVEFVDGEPLFLALEVFMKSGLRTNDEISADRFLSLVNENKLYFIRQRAFRLLGLRLHSKGELKNKLIQKSYEKNLVEDVLNELEQKKYLDDREFALQFAAEKSGNKKWSRKKIYSELIKKNIASDLIQEILDEVINEELNYKNAFAIAQRKMETLRSRNKDDKVVKEKLTVFLKMRGYGYSTIKNILGQLFTKHSGD